MNKNPRDENGRPHGLWEIYFPNTRLFYKGCYIHGDRYGYWESYYDNGVLDYKGYYIHGKKFGFFDNHWNDGKFVGESYYHMDIKVYQTNKNKVII